MGVTLKDVQAAAQVIAGHVVPRIAPTEQLPDAALPLRGVVHDPTTRFMGGVAGHAGVFSTAGDLARFAEMMLNLGELDGTRRSALPGATHLQILSVPFLLKNAKVGRKS